MVQRRLAVGRRLRRASTSTSSMAIFPLRMLGMWIGEGQRATASGERIFQIIDEPEEIRDRPGAGLLPAGPGRVRFEGVDLRLRPRAAVLVGHRPRARAREDRRADRPHRLGQDDARLADPALLRRRPTGRVTIDGADVRDVTLDVAAPRDRRDRAGPVPLLGDRAREPRSSGGRRRPTRRSSEAARLAQAHEFIERLPDGYDTVIGERGITLSGGQRQRLAIARALVVDPRILILDDATASVDPSTEARIRLGLREAMRGRTTVIIAHRASTIALADEIVVLDHGRDRRPRHPRRGARRRATSTARSTSTAASSARSPSRRSHDGVGSTEPR